MNYSRFYALLRLLPCRGDDEEMKEQLVADISHGRTTSLRELTGTEYHALCEHLDQLVGQRKALREARSRCLRVMTALGIDTSDWSKVDDFCQQPRIAAKPFRYLDLVDLAALERKLYAIERKRPPRSAAPSKPSVVIIDTPSSNFPNNLPS